MNIGEKILEIMEAEKVSQTELAERLNSNRKNLNQTLRRNQDIKFSQVVEIFDKLGYDVKIEKRQQP